MMYFGDKKMPDFCHRRYPVHYTTALNLLMKMGVSLDRINLLAIGEYQNYKGEIHNQSPAPGQSLDRKTRITLHVGYPSAVDFMPYQFFYGLGGKRPSSGDWEYNARTLMAPYDAAVIRNDARARYLALRYNFGVVDFEYLKKYINLFDFALSEDSPEFEEIVAWANILPDFHLWSGNPEKVTKILAYLFKHPFRIVENVKAEYEIPPRLQYRLGVKSGRLGRETVLGGTFSECDSSYRVIMSEMEPEEIADYLPGRPRRKKLEWFLDTCMPSHLEYQISFRVKAGAVRLGADQSHSRLGFATVL